MTSFLIFLGLIAAIVFWAIGIYNRLVNERNRVRNGFAQIDVQLTRRHDLIPNLVETAKGYMTPERETLENITKARNLATQGGDTVGDQAQREQELSRAMNQFYVVVENYPDLKADQNFMQIQEELTSTENKIGFARQFYNDEVTQMNNKVEMFPGNIVAGMFNFKQEEFFEIEDEAEREAPKVSFS